MAKSAGTLKNTDIDIPYALIAGQNAAALKNVKSQTAAYRVVIPRAFRTAGKGSLVRKLFLRPNPLNSVGPSIRQELLPCPPIKIGVATPGHQPTFRQKAGGTS
ncbi:MAG: hypothetical protein ABGX09_03570 [Thioclava sp.]